MVNHNADSLSAHLKAAEPYLDDAGFSQIILNRLPARPRLMPVPTPTWQPIHYLVLVLALLAGVLVAMIGFFSLNLPALWQASQQPLLAIAGMSLSGFGLWLALGWSLTLAGCGWSIHFAR